MVFPVITENDKTLPIYVTGIGNQNPQPPIERINGFPSYQVFLITNGSGILHIEKKRIAINKGDIIFLPKNVYHGYYPTTTPFTNRWVSFDGAYVEQIISYLGLNDFCVIKCKDYAETYKNHKVMFDMAEDDNCNMAVLSSMFYKYLFENFVLKDYCEEQTYLDTVKSYLHKNYDKNISLQELSELADVSKYKLCKEFKKKYRVSVFEYLLKIRIQQSKYLLVENPNMKIKEIAEKTGFNDTSYFIRVFKQFESVTPTEYRDR